MTTNVDKTEMTTKLLRRGLATLTDVRSKIDGQDPVEIVRRVGQMKNSVALSSFGIQASPFLHMLSKACPSIPVLMVDTGYLPTETYMYAESLSKELALNLITCTSELTPARMEAIYGPLWEGQATKHHALYGKLRKKDPANAALQSLGAEIVMSGLRSTQTQERSQMEIVSEHENFLKVLPLLSMSDDAMDAYMEQHDLPPHPLAAHGYASVGDTHSSRPLAVHEDRGDARKSRFGGKFRECGLHLPVEEGSYLSALDILCATPVGSTGVATHMVKKLYNGEMCSKCKQIAHKIVEDGMGDEIGAVSVFGRDDDASVLASSFGEGRVPFFIVKEPGKMWRSIVSYGEWRKLIRNLQVTIP